MTQPVFILLITTVIAFASSPALAQSQHELNRQAATEFEKADKTLNVVYKKLLATLDSEAQQKLKAAQRTWVAFRDAEAEMQADLEARDGSMAPLIYNGKRSELTKARIKELEKILKDFAN